MYQKVGSVLCSPLHPLPQNCCHQLQMTLVNHPSVWVLWFLYPPVFYTPNSGVASQGASIPTSGKVKSNSFPLHSPCFRTRMRLFPAQNDPNRSLNYWCWSNFTPVDPIFTLQIPIFTSELPICPPTQFASAVTGPCAARPAVIPWSPSERSTEVCSLAQQTGLSPATLGDLTLECIGNA